MPFSQDSKARMFIKSARICCLCYKKCGTNIEAAHIVAEGNGGSNDETNGIPVCFDCHQEIGGYDAKHPKGNKFTDNELIARRDRVYSIVESGSSFAQLVLGSAAGKAYNIELENLKDVPKPKESFEARKFLESVVSMPHGSTAPAGKLKLLSEMDRAFVLDQLVEMAPTSARAVEALLKFATSPLLNVEFSKVIVERTIRHVTLYGTIEAKAAMLMELPAEVLTSSSEEVREALFEELIPLIEADQFNDVNLIVPALELHGNAVPPKLAGDFVIALLCQSGSKSYDGAPAARRTLKTISVPIAVHAMEKLTAKFLLLRFNNKYFRDFIRQYLEHAPTQQRTMLDDFLALKSWKYGEKYCADDE